MLKVNSFFKRFYKLVKSISKKSYRTCAIISTSMLVVAVIALSTKDFGGSGKNRMITTDNNTNILESDDEDDDKALAANNETVIASIEEVSSELSLTSNNDNPNADVVFNQQDYEVLCKIVQAEAGGEDEMGKILVANVIINRVKSDIFPNTISEVVYDNHHGLQFQPTKYSSFNATEPSQSTILSVDRALAGEDYSRGALYFAVQTSSGSWFNTKLVFLFEYSGHYFYM